MEGGEWKKKEVEREREEIERKIKRMGNFSTEKKENKCKQKEKEPNDTDTNNDKLSFISIQYFQKNSYLIHSIFHPLYMHDLYAIEK